LAIFCRNLALLCQVNLVAYDYYGTSVAPDLSCLLDPTIDVLKALARGDIVADYYHLRVIDVGGDQGAEPFLASCVP